MVVAIVFGLARRYAPASAPAAPSPPLAELGCPVRMTQWIVGAAMLGIGFLIFISLHQVLVIANQYFASLDGPANFILLPQSAIWFFLPGFAAITLTWDLTLWGWSVFGSKELALQYEYWSNAKAGFNATRVLRIMTAVVVLPIAGFTALALPEHDSLQETVIRSHGYGWVGAKTFNYSNARALAVIDGFRDRDGRLTKRAGCVLYFPEGRKWSSAKIGDFKLTVDSKLLDFLEAKTRLRPKYAETEAEINADN